MFTRGFGRLGAVSAVLLAWGCGGNAAGPAASQENNGSQDTELGEAFASCTTGTGWNSPNLVINASATTSHSIILSPGGGVVKVNGHTCVDSNGTAIQLSVVKSITLTGANAGSPDTFVLDFSLGLPSGQLLSADGIVVNGNEASGTTNSDIVIFKGSAAADTVTVGRSTSYASDQTMVMALTASAKTNNIKLKNLGDAADAHPPTMIFMLANGDDVFSAMGGIGTTYTAAVATPITVYGGAGNDKLSGGAGNDTLYGGPGNDTFVSSATDGADKYDGGGDTGDLMDYSGRATGHPVFVDMNSTVVKIWGKSVLGATMASETVDIDPGSGTPVTVTFGTEATPMAIRDVLNTAIPGVATLVGTRLLLASTDATNGNIVISSAVAGVTSKLGLSNGTYASVGNDGEANEHDDVQNIAYLYGGAGDDTLVGSDTANVIDGKAGDDILNGGPVNANCTLDADTLRGDVGNDWFDMGTVPDCSQTVTDVSGVDVVDYSQRTAAVAIKIDNSTGSGKIVSPAVESDKLSTDIEVVLGSAFGDTIVGNGSTNYIFGGPGGDTVSAGPGNDYVWGGAGADQLNGEAGDDTFFELTAYQAANAANEPLASVASGKWKGLGLAIYGTDVPGGGNDVVNGGIGTDKVDLSDATNPVVVTLCIDAASTGVTGTGTGCGAAGNYGADDDDGIGSNTTNNYANVEWIAGGTANNMLVGTSADEVFEGGAGTDVILGQGGNDTIYGFADGGTDGTNTDLLCGGDGDDTITGGAAATVEGEGQMSTTAPNKLDVTLTDGSTKDVNTCVTRAQTYAIDKSGVNVCFGGATYADCANH